MILLPALLVPALLVMGAGTDPQPLELSLDDCIRLALSNNLSMQTARLDAEAAVQDFNATWGQFDTIYFLTARAGKATTAPQPATLSGSVNTGKSFPSTTQTVDLSTGFRGVFLTGTQWSIEAGPNLSDLSSSNLAFDETTQTSSVQPFSSEQVRGHWNLSVTQPLLRNGADDFTISGLELARHDATIAALAAEDIANTTLESVTQAYWTLVYSRQNVKTAELSVTLATDLLDITRRKFDQGLQNKIEVTQAEAELAARKQELIIARNDAEAAEDSLRTFVLAPQDKEQWDRALVTLTPPTPPQPSSIDLDTAINTALEYRPDVASARESVQRSDVAVRQAENQTRPILDLTGSYGVNSNEAAYSSAFDHLDDTSFNQAAVALAFELPIGNRGAGYTLRRTQVQRQRSGVVLRETEMNAVAGVRGAVRDVQAQAERVVAATETVRLQQETYDGEQRRYENDLSTPFQVRQTQRDLLQAIDAQTLAQLDLENARTALLAAQGRLLYAYGVERSLPELSLEDAPPAP